MNNQPDQSSAPSPAALVPAGVAIVGTGSYLPERVLTNAELETLVDTTDEWIVTRTGIHERRIAAEDEAASDMASQAARRALEDAGVDAADVGLIIVATCTPDMMFPNTACFVQAQIGAAGAICFDIEVACSGFLYGLDIGRHFIASGAVKTALIIGSEKLSVATDWEDRATCVLFGDGAGAAVVQAADGASGVVTSVLGSDGTLADLLKIPGGGSRNPTTAETLDERLQFMKMNGREVFRHAVRTMSDAAVRALAQCGRTIEDVDAIIPHQANRRIIQAIGQRLNFPLEKVYTNMDRYGNMSAASVAVALDEAAHTGFIKTGDLVVMIVFGGGFTWGATVIVW